MSVQIPDINYASIMPEICVAITGIVIMMYDAFTSNSKKSEISYVAIAGTLASLISVIMLWESKVHSSFGGMLITDKLRICFDIIVLVAVGISILISTQFLDSEQLPIGEYYALLMFGTVGMLLINGSGDLSMLFLGLEISSITTYILAGFRRKDLKSNEAALKYFILGSFATGLLLYGIALMYGATKTTNIANIQTAFINGQILFGPLFTIGAALILIGLSFKIALAPFHTWAPDVYEGAPTPVTAFMATAPKIAIFAIFMRFFLPLLFNNAEPHMHFQTAISIMAVLSMIVGNLVAITQTNMKRMLAYSSIAHVGYAMIGILANDWNSVVFYLLAYSITSLGAFAVIGVFAQNNNQHTNIESYSGLGFRSFGLSILLTIFLLSLAGLPLTAGFMGKLVVFQKGWQTGHHKLVLIAVINSVISLYYYLRPLVFLFFKESEESNFIKPITLFQTKIALILTIASLFYLGLFPGKIIETIKTSPAENTKLVLIPNSYQFK